MGLALKGERPAEMVGLRDGDARARDRRCRRPSDRVFDTCGTGGDGATRSTSRRRRRSCSPAAGVRVAKHGNRAASSRAAAPTCSKRSASASRRRPTRRSSCARRGAASRSSSRRPGIRRCGTPGRRAASWACARRSICSARSRIPRGPRGSSSASRVRSTRNCSRARSGQLGSERAWVVYGADGLDEMSTTGYTKVSELRDGDGATRSTCIRPTSGLPVALGRAICAGGNADGERRDDRAAARRRAGTAARHRRCSTRRAALLIAGAATSLADGVAGRERSIDCARKARAALERLQEVCPR